MIFLNQRKKELLALMIFLNNKIYFYTKQMIPVHLDQDFFQNVVQIGRDWLGVESRDFSHAKNK